MTGFRYQQRNTPIHRLNPLGKLAWVGNILILTLIFENPVYLALVFLSTIPVVVEAKVVRQWFGLIRLALFLSMGIILINALVSNEGSHVLLETPFRIPELGHPRVTLEALAYGGVMSIRLMGIISAFAIITLTVHPDELMLSLIKLRIPFKPVLVITLATRFLPTLIDDAERITDAQRSRGVEMDRGNLIRRARSRSAVLVPLLSNSLDRAIQVAEAMESRAFGSGTGRTFYRGITLTLTDALTVLMALSAIAFGSCLRLTGHGLTDFYPTISGIGIPAAQWLMLLALALLVLSIMPLAGIKGRLDIDPN